MGSTPDVLPRRLLWPVVGFIGADGGPVLNRADGEAVELRAVSLRCGRGRS